MLAEWREERTTNASAARRSSALHGAAAALIVACTRGVGVWPYHGHGLGLISLRDERERLHSRAARSDLRTSAAEREPAEPADAGLSYFKVCFEKKEVELCTVLFTILLCCARHES